MAAHDQDKKVAVSVSEMARMTGLSRARFYKLQDAGAFPRPSYDPETGRPFFSEAQQAACLDVRQRNCGIDGKPILFYAKRVKVRPTVSRPRRSIESQANNDVHADILEAVKSLGLTRATTAQVKATVAELFPQGMTGIDQEDVVRRVFLQLQSQNPANAAGR